MTIKLVALVLLCLMIGTAVAQEPKVTSLMSKDLPENPGREALMITVEHAPGGSSAIHRHNAHAFVYVLEGSVVMQLKGGQQVTPLMMSMSSTGTQAAPSRRNSWCS
jgi:quercetin dioxygenase-like cupin family protein